MTSIAQVIEAAESFIDAPDEGDQQAANLASVREHIGVLDDADKRRLRGVLATVRYELDN